MAVIQGGGVTPGAYGIWLYDGPPVDGVTFADQAPPAALLLDTKNADLYINTGTQKTPTWTKLLREDASP